MSSRRGAGVSFVAGSGNNTSSKGKNVFDTSSTNLEQLSQGVAGIDLDSSQDGGDWEVIPRKSKNRAGSSAAKPWGAQNPNPKAWGHQDAIQKQGLRTNNGSGSTVGNTWATQNTDSRLPTGRGNARSQIVNRGLENNYVAPQPVIPPPLQHGWNWKSRAGAQPSNTKDGQDKEDINIKEEANDVEDDDDDDDDDGIHDTDDDLLSDEFDSDTSQKSHDTRKKSRWFKKFFDSLDRLTIEEINEPERQWHCPACQGGPGAIDWYRGLQPLITHAKTKGSNRMKLHRELAQLLDEELHRKGTSVVPAGEMFGLWRGLEEEKDHDIVWPPMVVIMNTILGQDENEKWIGMGNQELLDYFSQYAAAKARHSYGPQGHRGMSVLIFEASARGYFEAERLHKHFADQGTDREAWIRRRILFHQGGKRQLYGYMATKEDIDIFNQHSQGKSRLKFDIRSYQEMVVDQLRQMGEDNQQLNWFKNLFSKEQMHTKALEESLGIVSEKLRKTTEENRIVRQRTKIQHEQNKEEMDFQDKFFKEQIRMMHEQRDAKEEDFEKLQQQERKKFKQSSVNPSNTDEYKRRAEEISNFIECQDKEMEEFVAERDRLVEEHEKKLAAMRRRHWEENVELERDFDADMDRLMEKYAPH